MFQFLHSLFYEPILRANQDADMLYATRKDKINFYRRRAWITIVVATVCLFAIHYLSSQALLYDAVLQLEKIFSIPSGKWFNAIINHHYKELFEHFYGIFVLAFFLLIIPMLTVKFVFREPLNQYGWQIGDTFKHKKLYIVSMLVLMISMYILSINSQSFADFYPFYHQASRSWFDFVVWEMLYVTLLVSTEFFFRGFLLFGLRLPLGGLSIAVMLMPYMAVHLPKLWPEALSSIVFGIFLGLVALRSGSILGGIGLHISVAFTLDIAGILQGKGLPKIFF